MDSGFGPGDLDLLRAYVTAKDGHEYDNLDNGIVSLDLTHNYLKVYIHDIRLPLTSTVVIILLFLYRYLILRGKLYNIQVILLSFKLFFYKIVQNKLFLHFSLLIIDSRVIK